MKQEAPIEMTVRGVKRDGVFGFYEVGYRNGMPEFISKVAVSRPSGRTFGDLARAVLSLKEALQHPVLDWDLVMAGVAQNG